MFQFKNPVPDSSKSNISDKLPTLQSKIKTFRDDLGDFEKGNPRDDFFANTPNDPKTPLDPFQSVPMPPPLRSETAVPFAKQPETGGSSQINSFFSGAPLQSTPVSAHPPLSSEKTSPDLKNLPLQEKKQGSKIAVFTVIFIVLAVISGGGYYYWFFLKDRIRPISSESSTSQGSSPQQEPGSKVDPQNKKMHRLFIDTTLGPSEIKNAVQNFSSSFSAEAAENDLSELKLFNRENSPIGKKELAAGFGFVIPDSIFGKLSEDFSLFVKKENGTSKLGLAFKTVTSANLTGEMRSWEPMLVSNLTPLFPEKPHVSGTASFNSSQYRSADIRYLNLSSPSNLSLDYSIVSNFLIIGTSKDALRTILDYMSEK